MGEVSLPPVYLKLECGLTAFFDPPKWDYTTYAHSEAAVKDPVAHVATASLPRVFTSDAARKPIVSVARSTALPDQQFEWKNDQIFSKIFTDIFNHPDADEHMKQQLPYFLEKSLYDGRKKAILEAFQDGEPGLYSEFSGLSLEHDSARPKYSAKHHRKDLQDELDSVCNILRSLSSRIDTSAKQMIFYNLQARAAWHGVTSHISYNILLTSLYELEENLISSLPAFISDAHRQENEYHATLRHDFCLAHLFVKAMKRWNKNMKKTGIVGDYPHADASVLAVRGPQARLRSDGMFQDLIKATADAHISRKQSLANQKAVLAAAAAIPERTANASHELSRREGKLAARRARRLAAQSGASKKAAWAIGDGSGLGQASTDYSVARPKGDSNARYGRRIHTHQRPMLSRDTFGRVAADPKPQTQESFPQPQLPFSFGSAVRVAEPQMRRELFGTQSTLGKTGWQW